MENFHALPSRDMTVSIVTRGALPRGFILHHVWWHPDGMSLVSRVGRLFCFHFFVLNWTEEKGGVWEGKRPAKKSCQPSLVQVNRT